MSKSINTIAQENVDATDEATVKHAWRAIAYADGETACTAERVALRSGLPVPYVQFVCGMVGYALR